MSTYSISRPQFIDSVQGIRGFLSELAATLLIPSRLDKSIAYDRGAVGESHLITQVREGRNQLFALLYEHDRPIQDAVQQRRALMCLANLLYCDAQMLMATVAQAVSPRKIEEMHGILYSMTYFHLHLLEVDPIEMSRSVHNSLLLHSDLMTELLHPLGSHSIYGEYKNVSRRLALLFAFAVVGDDLETAVGDSSAVALRAALFKFMEQQSTALLERMVTLPIMNHRKARQVRRALEAQEERGAQLLFN